MTFISIMALRTSMMVVSGVVVRTVRVMMADTSRLEISSETFLRMSSVSVGESME